MFSQLGPGIESVPITSPPACICAGPQQSAFQREMRDGAAALTHHIAKEMNELNLERCKCIPTNTPGADWRCLEALVRDDPSREKFKVRQPVRVCDCVNVCTVQ